MFTHASFLNLMRGGQCQLPQPPFNDGKLFSRFICDRQLNNPAKRLSERFGVYGGSDRNHCPPPQANISSPANPRPNPTPSFPASGQLKRLFYLFRDDQRGVLTSPLFSSPPLVFENFSIGFVRFRIVNFRPVFVQIPPAPPPRCVPPQNSVRLPCSF